MYYEITSIDNLLILEGVESIFLVQGESHADIFDIKIPRESDIEELEEMSFTLKGNIGSYEIREVLTKQIQESLIVLRWSPGILWTSNYGSLNITLIATRTLGEETAVAKWVLEQSLCVRKDAQGENTPDIDVSQQLLNQVQEFVSSIDVEGLVFDHNSSTSGRDHVDAHPISAITELSTALEQRPIVDEEDILSGNLLSYSMDEHRIIDTGFCCDDFVKTSEIQDYRDIAYTYTQRYASAAWDIIHNLGKYPSVSVVDSAGTAVVGDLQYINNNQLIIRFSGAFSGKAYLN